MVLMLPDAKYSDFETTVQYQQEATTWKLSWTTCKFLTFSALASHQVMILHQSVCSLRLFITTYLNNHVFGSLSKNPWERIGNCRQKSWDNAQYIHFSIKSKGRWRSVFNLLVPIATEPSLKEDRTLLDLVTAEDSQTWAFVCKLHHLQSLALSFIDHCLFTTCNVSLWILQRKTFFVLVSNLFHLVKLA